MWSETGVEGGEALKIKWELPRYTRGRVLDLGAGATRVFPHFTTVDNCAHERELGITHIDPDIRADATDLSMFADASFDAVLSSHLLEHIKDFEAALAEWFRLVKVGGYLILHLPHKDLYPNIGQVGANRTHVHDFLPSDINAAMRKIGSWDLVENQVRDQDNEYSFLQVFRKESPELGTRCTANIRKYYKRATVVRFGALGDLLMASSVFAGLKQAGYHVTVYASPPGSDVIAHDPNIDDLVLLDKDQIPNHELGQFFPYLETRCDVFVNLCESVEGSLLAIPGRPIFKWSQPARHALMDRNYLEIAHALAGVPHKPQVRFYPTEMERAWATSQRSQMLPKALVWSLAGSSIHKVYPHMDGVIANLLNCFPDLTVVLVGGPECKGLESGWQDEARVICTSGQWSIRQSLAFAEEADVVVGPETGVLNAVSGRTMAKVVFLSHSSHENLTRDWINTTALSPPNLACYPCHQMHVQWETCNKDEATGTAKCAAQLTPEIAFDAIATALERVADPRWDAAVRAGSYGGHPNGGVAEMDAHEAAA